MADYGVQRRVVAEWRVVLVPLVDVCALYDGGEEVECEYELDEWDGQYVELSEDESAYYGHHEVVEALEGAVCEEDDGEEEEGGRDAEVEEDVPERHGEK